MSQPGFEGPFIRNKAVAAFVFCFTALCTVLDCRSALTGGADIWKWYPRTLKSHASWHAFIPPRQHPQWPIDLHFLHFLPNWAAITINLFFCACFLWIAVECWRMSRGTERFLLGSFGTAAFLGVITNLVPASTVPLIRDVHAALMAVAFLAALAIFVSMLRKDTSMENHTQ